MENAVLKQYRDEFDTRVEAARQQQHEDSEARINAARVLHDAGALQIAYEGARDGDGATIPQALAAIAAFFYDPADNMDPDRTGPDNALWFQQRGVLSNLVQNALWQHDRQEERYLKARENAVRKRAQFRDDEISILNLRKAADWLKDEQLKLATLADWINQTQAAYEAITGEKWKPFVKVRDGKDGKQQTKDAVLAELDGLI